MPRPRVPLISKRKALEAALSIIDTEGIDALSIRRLAEEMNVNGASLYHHFQNKNEIVVGAARLALDDVRTPLTGDQPWRVWMLRNGRALRQALREHPDLVPVMLRLGPLQIGHSVVDTTVELLKQEGVPVGAIAPMLEALELYAVASALQESAAKGDLDDLPQEHITPNLAAAFANRALSADDIFDKVCGQIMDVIVATAAERAAAVPLRARPSAKRGGSRTTHTKPTARNRATQAKRAADGR